MERLVMLEGGGVPPYFAYQGETKGLRENGLHQGETKGLVGERTKERRKATWWGVPKWHKSRVPSA